MGNLKELYQEVILDHSRHPRNAHRMEDATQKAEGYNPLCGDKLTLYLKLKSDCVIDASFEGSGCAISTASVSILTEVLKGKTKQEAFILFDKFHQMLTDDHHENEKNSTLGKLKIFEGVKEFPMRVKCATLSWHTLKAALNHEIKAVTTE